MKYYEVRVKIPTSIEKTIYIDDATSKTDAIIPGTKSIKNITAV